MTASWDSLYLPSADAERAVALLRDTLVSDGYQLYDPFGLIPGRTYSSTVRLFVGPQTPQWLRIIGAIDEELMRSISHLGLCLWLSLDGAQARIETWREGDRIELHDELIAHLRPGLDAADLKQALSGDGLALKETTPDLFLQNLPDDVQALAGKVDKGQAQKMFDRLSGGLMKKVAQHAGSESDSMADAARSLIAANGPNWRSADGQKLIALAACLDLPENWREPDFVTLRDAYQLHNRLRRKPQAHRYPGDEETMSRVPNALEYVPVYGGKNA